MKPTFWTIIFCQSCGEPTPPKSGMKTPFGFLCDYCMNTTSFPTEKGTTAKALD